MVSRRDSKSAVSRTARENIESVVKDKNSTEELIGSDAVEEKLYFSVYQGGLNYQVSFDHLKVLQRRFSHQNVNIFVFDWP